jgi:hypothetical protein
LELKPAAHPTAALATARCPLPDNFIHLPWHTRPDFGLPTRPRIPPGQTSCPRILNRQRFFTSPEIRFPSCSPDLFGPDGTPHGFSSDQKATADPSPALSVSNSPLSPPPGGKGSPTSPPCRHREFCHPLAGAGQKSQPQGGGIGQPGATPREVLFETAPALKRQSNPWVALSGLEPMPSCSRSVAPGLAWAAPLALRSQLNMVRFAFSNSMPSWGWPHVNHGTRQGKKSRTPASALTFLSRTLWPQTPQKNLGKAAQRARLVPNENRREVSRSRQVLAFCGAFFLSAIIRPSPRNEFPAFRIYPDSHFPLNRLFPALQPSPRLRSTSRSSPLTVSRAFSKSKFPAYKFPP